MYKPHFVVTALGLVVAGAGAACGYLLPVGLYCSGAFSLQKASKEDPDVMHAMAALATCKVNAQQYAPLWTTVIIVGVLLFAVGLVWTLVASTRSSARRDRTDRTSAAEQPKDRAPHVPSWPLLLGLAIIGTGIILGYTVSVGPYCDGAFTQQTSAAGADIATAMNGRASDYSAECREGAGQQSAIYWGVIGFGGAVFILGLVLRTVLGRRTVAPLPATITDELEQLARLLERGVLTQDEFDQQKGRLLAQR